MTLWQNARSRIPWNWTERREPQQGSQPKSKFRNLVSLTSFAFSLSKLPLPPFGLLSDGTCFVVETWNVRARPWDICVSTVQFIHYGSASSECFATFLPNNVHDMVQDIEPKYFLASTHKTTTYDALLLGYYSITVIYQPSFLPAAQLCTHTYRHKPRKTWLTP